MNGMYLFITALDGVKNVFPIFQILQFAISTHALDDSVEIALFKYNARYVRSISSNAMKLLGTSSLNM